MCIENPPRLCLEEAIPEAASPALYESTAEAVPAVMKPIEATARETFSYVTPFHKKYGLN